MIRFILAAAFLSCAMPAVAQEVSPHLSPSQSPQPKPDVHVQPSVPLPPPLRATVQVSILTSEGPITLALEKELAPVTTANFLRYVDEKRFDGTSFYRAAKVAPGYGLIQGGTRSDPKRTLPPIAHEPTTITGLSHLDGAISMGRNAPGTAAGDFFITVGAIPSMDANPMATGDNQGFAVFGQVVQGMDVVRKILDESTTAEGPGVMKGQMLAAPVKIVTARRVVETR